MSRFWMDLELGWSSTGLFVRISDTMQNPNYFASEIQILDAVQKPN